MERPEVHRAYLALVPRTVGEKEFWERWLKQQYKRMARRYVGLCSVGEWTVLSRLGGKAGAAAGAGAVAGRCSAAAL